MSRQWIADRLKMGSPSYLSALTSVDSKASELGVRSSHLTLAVKACSVLVWPGHYALNLGARFII